MASLEHGPLQGNYAPDYDGRSTVNLLSSLIHARGGRSPHRELLCKDDHALIHTPPGLEPLYMQGSHGGMSAPEIQIPLYAVRC